MANSQSPTGCVTLAKMIAHARLKRGTSQQLLATLTGIDRRKLQKLETAGRRVHKVDLAAIEKALNVEFKGIHRLGQSRHRPERIWCAVDLAPGTPFVLCRETGEVLFEPPEWAPPGAEQKERASRAVA